MKKIILPISLLFWIQINAQYAPAANETGTDAIHKDSSVFINWAKTVVEFNPGPQDIAISLTNLVDFGVPENALHKAEGNSINVVSLGDGGSIVLGFQYPIKNLAGPDFAVFENSFSHTFLELAHVEVSTDGVHFVRIPSYSNIQTASQVASFESTNPTEIHNLAGKYIQGYGTPFDLEDIIDLTGINLDSINFVKIIDVVGSINTLYGSYDSQGTIINDPYPTEFSSGGFDLDAIGVINENNIFASTGKKELNYSIYPNPCSDYIQIKGEVENAQVQIINMEGKLVLEIENYNHELIDLRNLNNGVYVLKLIQNDEISLKKIIVQKIN